MNKNLDVIKILLIVIIGMFIPFLGSITITYGFNLTKTASTFGLFLLIFGIELIIVYLYYLITSKIANKKMIEIKQK
jgi:hypothetical protein